MVEEINIIHILVKLGDKMPLKCPSGTSQMYRFKKGTNIRLGGCAKKGKFTKVMEVKKVISKIGGK